MPSHGMRWRHVICHARNTWLHGDEKGFRDRHHRIHSTGDYKNPPPKIEHEGLRRWAKNRSGDPASFPQELRPLIARAFVDRLNKEGFKVLTVSCSQTHVHVLAELPEDLPDVKNIVGRCKRNACGAVRRELPGSIWAANGSFKLVKDQEHQQNAFSYISMEQEAGTFVWTFRGEEYWME